MSTNRRQFLARSSALTGAAMAGAFGRFGIESASAQAADYKALVCLFQFGGADSNNMVVPDTDYAQYGLVRTAGSQVGIPQANLLTFTASRQGGKSYGFHPSLQPLKDLYDQKKLAVVANAGTLIAPITMADYKAGKNRPPNLFSHSDQQAQWQSAIVDDAPRSGWGGRMMERLLAADTVNRGYGVLSLAGGNLWENGDRSLAAYKVSASGNFGFDFYDPTGRDPVSTAITESLAERREHLLEQAWNDVVGRSIENQRVLTQALESATLATAFPDTSLGSQLRMVARLVAARSRLGLQRQCFFCSIGGFDLHDNLISQHPTLLGRVSDAMTAFYNATAALGVPVCKLPSTSPANAVWSFERKRAAWGEALAAQGLL